MQDEKLIEALKKETERYIAEDILYDDVYVGPITEKDGMDCAVHAMEWYRNHVWHSTDEKPVHQSSCIVKYKLGIIDGKVRYSTTILKFNTVDEWFYVGSVFDSSCKSMPLNTTDIVCWAHVDELLPIEEK